MPFVHGKSTVVLLDGIDLSPYLNLAGTAVDVPTSQSTAFGSAWKSHLAGVPGAKVDLGGMYDPAQLSMRNLLGVDANGAQGVLTVAPGGASAIGSPTRMVPVASTQYSESSPIGGIIGLKYSVLAAGPLGIGIMLHPLAEDTNTTTGADRDDGAATSTGWQAHLHVTAVDAGSWVIKLQDAATLPTYADVAGGSFTAVTVAGGQRLTASGTATLRRFVRYIATRTGGSAGDGITFALAYARNV